LAWYNRQAFHAGPESLNFASNTIAQDHLGDPAFEITALNCPLPKSNEDLALDKEEKSIALTLGIDMALGLAFLLGSFILFPVNERNQHAKHIQLVSGLEIRTLVFLTTPTRHAVSHCIAAQVNAPLTSPDVDT
jgi:hypothetical protein